MDFGGDIPHVIKTALDFLVLALRLAGMHIPFIRALNTGQLCVKPLRWAWSRQTRRSIMTTMADTETWNSGTLSSQLFTGLIKPAATD